MSHDVSDRAATQLGDGLVASRDLMRRSHTLIALSQCPGPALPDPIPGKAG